jgi:hypothetical protein
LPRFRGARVAPPPAGPASASRWYALAARGSKLRGLEPRRRTRPQYQEDDHGSHPDEQEHSGDRH